MEGGQWRVVGCLLVMVTIGRVNVEGGGSTCEVCKEFVLVLHFMYEGYS